ncbi:hypothetical protein KP509_24G027000 [Ceratopteris richardii]|uniref:Methyltransferase n=1 Tax=Ceratopteris richardii TaxID=49495 RepID=A0A8T2RVH5_CERRI|nr:hypothetical protein KP509_24G027000 [Ceratopteris richardii]KAH7299745.1 hypothetical protein KP509_24G027000 [Ceratopteris richardii]KAH7299746.1 hypothetical protein KP509_24G027000 [Ceratopteris richardii]KAH7299747.1 hypothetical protein KP509_24G027000 [Ceratopteris richardii]KAH7299748.1 hypothetical protein KP509_24G027000 [Ceratopteris richardii]
MAAGRYFQNDKRTPSYVMASIAIFVALCLLGMWMLSAPSGDEIASNVKTIPVDEGDVAQKKKEGEPQQFEESAGNVEQEISPKLEENPQSEYEGEKSEENKQTDVQQLEEKDEREGGPSEVKEEPEADPSNDKYTTDAQGGDEIEKKDEGLLQKEDKGSAFDESSGVQSEIQIENKEIPNDKWQTQANESEEEKEKIGDEEFGSEKQLRNENVPTNQEDLENESNQWVLCGFDGAVDYIPCLDNKEAIAKLTSRSHYEHRERHCPSRPPTCVVPYPENYHKPVPWPKSRNEIWYSNVPHPGLVTYKKDQNWVKKAGDKLIFPGSGTQFTHGALHYIQFLEQAVSDLMWGKHTRTILDVGCGVASFGGFLFEKEVLPMSFAPKDEHEAQIQLALERGIPAISAVMGTKRLVFPSNVYDAIHCARCRVPWHIEGGKLLLELNRVLRPGGYFIWSATPVYRKDEENVGIWKEMSALTKAMCWDMVAKTMDSSVGIGVAVFRKPTTNFCYENRKESSPPLCDSDDKPDAAWYVPMTACIHKLPEGEDPRGKEWPQEWPLRLTTAPTWLGNERGLYGRPAAADFRSDTEHWQRVVTKSYRNELGIDWSSVRNVMDMKAVYGGFAAALASLPLWVMNVVPYDEPDTLPIIFDRGLFGIYHDWCESFSSYPRTYDLLHVDHLFDKVKKRCSVKVVVAEMDRLLRPEGWMILRESVPNMEEVETLLKALHWDVKMTYSINGEGLLAVQKTKWRPSATS